MKWSTGLAVTLLLGCGVAAAQNTVPAGTSVAQQPRLAGKTVAEALVPFAYTVFGNRPDDEPFMVTGQVTSRVVKSIDGSYDFYWQIRVDDSAVTTFSLDRSFGGGPLNWRSDLDGSVAPTFVESASNFELFSFQEAPDGSSHLSRGTTSRWLFADSEATAFAKDANFRLHTCLGLACRGLGDSALMKTFAPAECRRPTSLLARLAG